MRRTIAALALVVFAACAHSGVTDGSVVADRVFCGLSIPGGGSVSEEEWNAFVREVVTPRFPNGLTIWRAEGQWRGADGNVVREPTMVIEILHPMDARLDREVEAIAEEYRRRFRQEAVMRVVTPARIDFVD